MADTVPQRPQQERQERQQLQAPAKGVKWIDPDAHHPYWSVEPAGGSALCANCLHAVDRHGGGGGDRGENGDVGLGCNVEIAVSWSDGPSGCACERCIAEGTECSVDGCQMPASRYRVDASGQIARDMCVRHYEEAEPYCKRYYELTGSVQHPPGETCGVDGCDANALFYRLGTNHVRLYMCVRHYEEAVPYSGPYYDLTGGRPFPEKTRCDMDGCGAVAVQRIEGGGGRGPPVNVCAVHYIEAAPSLQAALPEGDPQ